MRTGNGFICVYTITSETSLKEVKGIHQTMLRAKNADKVPMVLLGNKCDLANEREVEETDGKKLAAEFQCPFFETSAKSNINVTEAFLQVAREILSSAAEENLDRIEGKSVAAKKKSPCNLL